MHEMGIAIEIYRICQEAVRGHGPGRIDKVRLAVGELAAVEPDLISFAWQAVVAGSPDQGASLDVVWCPARQYCHGCGTTKTRAEGSWLRLCPDCAQPLEVAGGDELDVLDISFETHDADDADDADAIASGDHDEVAQDEEIP